jgi:hypothetical protein
VVATTLGSPQKALPLHKTSTKKAVVRQPLNPIFAEAIDEATSRATNYSAIETNQ